MSKQKPRFFAKRTLPFRQAVNLREDLPGPKLERAGLVPEAMPCYSFTICDPVEHIERIRQLQRPSVIALVSVSKLFLERATGVISPLLGNVHCLNEHLLPVDGRLSLNGADLVFCDSVAISMIQARKIHRYRVVSPQSLEYLKRVLVPRSQHE
jgi:hypothetical protein